MAFALLQWKEEVANFLDEIDQALAARSITLLALLAERGNQMQSHSKALGGGLFELKVDHRKRALRFMFMFWRGQIVVLRAFEKKSQKAPARELDLARERMRVVEAEEGLIEQLKLH